jgi:acetyl esterase/lipase
MGFATDRPAVLWCLAVSAAVAAWPRFAAAGAEAGAPKTYTYRTVGTCEIQADVYGAAARPGDHAATGPRPVVVWVHGGALIMGHRGQMDRALRDKLLQAGYVVVSIDYRLAPETKLPAILDDVQSACTWVREQGPRLFHADAKRLAVMGGSAGGYLTLASGYRVQPPPRALVSFWGYGDVAGAWYSKPDPFYSWLPPVPKDEALGAVGPRAGARPSDPVPTGTPGKHHRDRFYLYCRQQGLWPREVAGHDPDKEPRAFDALCPVRNVSARYPPTLLIHGTKDTDVPYEQSVIMAKELTRKGVEHELITIEGGGHGLGGVKPAVVADVHERVLAFLKKHLGP